MTILVVRILVTRFFKPSGGVRTGSVPGFTTLTSHHSARFYVLSLKRWRPSL